MINVALLVWPAQPLQFTHVGKHVIGTRSAQPKCFVQRTFLQWESPLKWSCAQRTPSSKLNYQTDLMCT